MKRDADKNAIGIWLDCYNNLNDTCFRVDSYPDERDRNAESIDALCRDSQGRTIGLEHTRIEAFPGEMGDNARFMEVLGKFEKDPGLAEIGVQTSASIGVGAIPKGVSWDTLSAELWTFLSKQVFGLRFGAHPLVFVHGSVFIPLRIEKRTYLPGQRGSFLVARDWPGVSNEPTLRKAFEEKLPKLRALSAATKILLLEQNSVAGAVSSDVAKYLAAQGLPEWMPDEMWLLWTGALEAEQYMHVAQLYPNMNNRKADWKDGTITTKYP